MGITIHLRGRLRNPALVHELSDEVAEYAEVLEWEHDRVSEPPLMGIHVTPHKDSETLSLLFDAEGILRNELMYGEGNDEWIFVKTQFAPPDIHIALCNLLKHLKDRYFESLDVIDDGEYYESGDRALLENQLGFTGAAINRLGKALEHTPDSDSVECIEDLVQQLERVLEETFEPKEHQENELLDRLNGPTPPYDVVERMTWDMHRWQEFWLYWDIHRSPALGFMQGKELTLASIQQALRDELEFFKQREKDQEEMMRRTEEIMNNALDLPDELDDDPDDDPDDDEGPEEPWEKFLPSREFEMESVKESPASHETVMDWYQRFKESLDAHKSELTPESESILDFVHSVILPVMVGMNMSHFFKKHHDMFLSVSSRLIVAAERFEYIEPLLRQTGEPAFTALADEASVIADSFRYEAGG